MALPKLPSLTSFSEHGIETAHDCIVFLAPGPAHILLIDAKQAAERALSLRFFIKMVQLVQLRQRKKFTLELCRIGHLELVIMAEAVRG